MTVSTIWKKIFWGAKKQKRGIESHTQNKTFRVGSIMKHPHPGEYRTWKSRGKKKETEFGPKSRVDSSNNQNEIGAGFRRRIKG